MPLAELACFPDCHDICHSTGENLKRGVAKFLLGPGLCRSKGAGPRTQSLCTLVSSVRRGSPPGAPQGDGEHWVAATAGCTVVPGETGTDRGQSRVTWARAGMQRATTLLPGGWGQLRAWTDWVPRQQPCARSLHMGLPPCGLKAFASVWPPRFFQVFLWFVGLVWF